MTPASIARDLEPKIGCECIAEINGKLDGQRLDTTIVISSDLKRMTERTYTDLRRTDTGKSENRRTKPRLAAHTFCPFCGNRYEAQVSA